MQMAKQHPHQHHDPTSFATRNNCLTSPFRPARSPSHLKQQQHQQQQHRKPARPATGGYGDGYPENRRRGKKHPPQVRAGHRENQPQVEYFDAHGGERREGTDEQRRSSTSDRGLTREARRGSVDVLTIDMIMHECGRSLIEPSAVSAPMDFLTSEAEFGRVWKVFKSWLCSAVSSKLRASVPNFFTLSYRVFNLGICIPTLELDARFLERYGISQEQSLSSKSSVSPRAPQQVEFSREALGKAAGLPPARAFYALEVILCAIGKEAGLGATLLVDCGVGVLAARGRVMKFTFVQGADSLEVVHREPTPGYTVPHPPGGRVRPSSSYNTNISGGGSRGGIHAFGKCYIPYTARGNKELALARSRETTALLRSLRDAHADRFLPPEGVEGEESMPAGDGVVEAMRSWNPGVALSSTASASASAAAAAAVSASLQPALGEGATEFMCAAAAPAAAQKKNTIAGGRGDGRAKSKTTILLGRMTSQLRGLRGLQRSFLGASTKSPEANRPTSTPPADPSQPPTSPPMPPLMDVHARLRGSVLSASSSPRPPPSHAGGECLSATGGGGGGAGKGCEGNGAGRATASRAMAASPVGCRPMGLEPTGVERLGSHYSPAAQLLYIDPERGFLTWRNGDTRDRPASAGGGACNIFRDGDEETVVSPTRQRRAGEGQPLPSPSSRQPEALCRGDSCAQKSAEGRAPAPTGEVGAAHPVPHSPCGTNREAQRRALAARVRPRLDSGNPGGGVQRDSHLLSFPEEGDGGPGDGDGECATEGAGGGGGGRGGGIGDKSESEAETAVVQAACTSATSVVKERLEAGFERYHRYIRRDPTLAESVTVLQPPWQVGIVRKVLEGLKRGFGGGSSGGASRGGRAGIDSFYPGEGTPDKYFGDGSIDQYGGEDSSCGSGAGEDKPTIGKRDGGRAGAAGAGAAAVSQDHGEEEEGNDEDYEENQDSFEVSGGACKPPAGLEPAAGVGEDGGGGGGDGGETAAVTAAIKPARTARRLGVQAPSGVKAGSGLTAGGTERMRGRGGKGEAREDEQMPDVPERLKAGVESRLEEACDAFRGSIRRAVLNYVLLDAGQRDRLGIPAVPPGFESEGWGWGKGRHFNQSPPEWRRRFLRAREALNGGQIAGSPALVAAQALLAECLGTTRLLRLPRSAAEIQAARWSPMTAEEFRSSQLGHLDRRVARVRRLLYPGLSDAIRTRLGGEVGDGSGGRDGSGAAAKGSAPPDGHVRRYLVAVNVMTASVLRGLVEAALSELLAFFRIHADVGLGVSDESKNGRSNAATDAPSAQDRHPSSTRGFRGGGGEEVRGDLACRSPDTNHRERGPTDEANDTAGAARVYDALDPEKEAVLGGQRELHRCPPTFKVFLEDSCSARSRRPTLTCANSLRDLKAAVMDVVRGVVMCFADVPRVTYSRADQAAAATAKGLAGWSVPAGTGGSAVDEAAALAGATHAPTTADETHRKSRLSVGRASMRQASNNSGNNGNSMDNGGSEKRPTWKRATSGSSGIKGPTAAAAAAARAKRVSLYSEPDSDSDDRSSLSTVDTGDGGEDGDDSCGSDDDRSEASSVPSLTNVFGRSVTRAFAAGGAGGGGGGGRGRGVAGGVHGWPAATDGAAGPSSPTNNDKSTLMVLSPTGTLVRNAIRDVTSCLRSGSSQAKAACKVYRPFESLLEEAAMAPSAANTGGEEATVSEKDLPRLAAALERYRDTAAVLRAGGDAAPVELPGTMVVVDCEETSTKLLRIAGDLQKGLLRRVDFTLKQLTSGITKQARSAILRLGKRPRSTEEMVEAIECLRTTRADEQIELKQRQVWMGQLLDFVLKHGNLQQDVIGAVAGVHRVMVELATATDKAGKAIAEGKAQLHKNLDKAKRRTEGDIESMQMRIAIFIDSDGRPREMSEKAADISKELDELKAQVINIGEEEAKVDGYTSGILGAQTDKVIAAFQPYADVWSLVGSVGPFITAIMRAPVTTLKPEEIAAEHASNKNRLEALQKTMLSRSHAVPARSAQEALRQLLALEKDIPIVRAFTNPHLKDTHWWQVSDLVGVAVGLDHPTTLQQLNELDVLTDAKVLAILRVSDEADAEFELEEGTAEVSRFVSEEAVLRLSLARAGSAGQGGGSDGGAEDNANPPPASGPLREDTIGPGGHVTRIDEDHLRRVLGQAEHWQKKVAEVKTTAAAEKVAAAAAAATANAAAAVAAAAAAAAAAGSRPEEIGVPEAGSLGLVERLEMDLSNLIRTGGAMLKCAELVVEIEAELEEETAEDETEQEGDLTRKDAIKRWQTLLTARCGQSLKDLVRVVEEELERLEEASEA